MSDEYGRLEREHDRGTRRLVDHAEKLARLPSVATCEGSTAERVRLFCEAKRITLEALAALDTRVRVDRNGGVELAWGYPAQLNGHRAVVTAIKYRSLDPSKPRYAETPSTYVEPLIVGNRHSLDWFLAEGESDASRLYGLVGDVAAVLVLPAGALTFKHEWARRIPRGATVHLCHDADDAGDKGAAKAAEIIGGRTVRIRPPLEGGDWCDWEGDRRAFVAIVQAARTSATEGFRIATVTARELCERPDPEHGGELLGPLVVLAGRTMVLGHTGHGKSTLIAHMAAAIVKGEPFLDWQGAGAVRALVVDLEQSEADAKRMLRRAGLAESEHVDVALIPDGLELDSDDDQLAELERLIVENEYAAVVFDPYYKAHRAEDSNAERQIDDLMRRLDLLRHRHGFALILGAHPRKPPVGTNPPLTLHDVAGSAAAVRPFEVIVGIERVSDGYSRLRFLKDRKGELPVPDAWGLLYDAEDGYRRDPNDGKSRDLRAEILAALEHGEWRTTSDLRRKQDEGGVGASPTTIRPVLDALTAEGLLEHEIGPAGRAPTAKCWRLSRTPRDTRDSRPSPGQPAGSGVTLSPPYRGDSEVTRETSPALPGLMSHRDTLTPETPEALA